MDHPDLHYYAYMIFCKEGCKCNEDDDCECFDKDGDSEIWGKLKEEDEKRYKKIIEKAILRMKKDLEFDAYIIFCYERDIERENEGCKCIDEYCCCFDKDEVGYSELWDKLKEEDEKRYKKFIEEAILKKEEFENY